MVLRAAQPSAAHRSRVSSAPRRRATILLAAGLLAVGIAMPTSAGAAPSTPAATHAATPAATDGASATACTGGAWPATVQGAPAVHAGSAAGDYLWHDATGWHLRVTHANSLKVGFSGTIRANKPLTVRGYKLETGDTFTVSADRLSVTYRFANDGGLDGLDFTTACATRLSVGARMNGALLPVCRIWIGRAGRHPLQNPFVILRAL